MPPLKRGDSLQDIDFTLRRQFNKTSFRYVYVFHSIFIKKKKNTTTNTHTRPHQREIILAALDGYDVFVQAATSFGKSLCFQLPAVIDRGSMFTLSSPFIMSIFMIIMNTVLTFRQSPSSSPPC
jgi:superfamily II DNA/RNA helicase